MNPETPARIYAASLVSELRLWARLIGTEPRGARDLLNRAADAIETLVEAQRSTDPERK